MDYLISTYFLVNMHDHCGGYFSTYQHQFSEDILQISFNFSSYILHHDCRIEGWAKDKFLIAFTNVNFPTQDCETNLTVKRYSRRTGYEVEGKGRLLFWVQRLFLTVFKSILGRPHLLEAQQALVLLVPVSVGCPGSESLPSTRPPQDSQYVYIEPSQREKERERERER